VSYPSVEVAVRRSTPADIPSILALLEASLGWLPDDQHERFFDWKHSANPFGTSPAWVAIDEHRGGRVVGFRTFLRWAFQRDGEIIRAVRAVDTATHPEYQGLGIFSRLTLRALEELRDEGVSFVFNTPNAQSLPGYLKMGWRKVGRLTAWVRPRRITAFGQLVRARTPAEKWSLPSRAGHAATEVLADPTAAAALLPPVGEQRGLRTRRTPEFLAWRYGFEPLAYRVIFAGNDVSDGCAIFRLRRRGRATEAAVTDVLLPDGASRPPATLFHRILSESGASYALRVDARASEGFLPLPGQGPILVGRDLTQTVAPKRTWRLSLGDVELF
jgi:GNAT superfamily N-acetyltransferase